MAWRALIRDAMARRVGGWSARYRYDSLTMVLRLIIPVSFLVETAERAVRSFEVEATERDIVPFPTQA